MKLNELTWPEIKDYLNTNQSLIVPFGVCEQHGPHLPLNTDTLLAEKIANEAAKETGILIAPTVNYGVDMPADRYFAGTNSVEEEDLRNYVHSMLSWWKLQGFKKFFLISAHGDPIHIKALTESDKDCVRVIELYNVNISDLLDKQKWCIHACEAETSVMLYLFPETVRKDKIVDFQTSPEKLGLHLNRTVNDPIKDSPGNEGYPSAATAKKGEAIYERIVENALRIIKNNN